MDVIERVEDQNKLIIRNSIRFLHNLTQTSQLSAPTLKSLYRTKSRLMELRRHIFLPQQKPQERCQQCFMNFSEGVTKFELQPANLSACAKKIVAKVKNNRLLTSYQKTYYKKLVKTFPNGFYNKNKLVLTCSYCKKNTTVWMDKPQRTKKLTTPKQKKKKPKKKDKFCGLNKNAVTLASATKQPRARTFVAPEESQINTTMSLTDTRSFETSEFIPLESNIKKIRFKKKKAETPKPVLSVVSKKLHKKNRNNLSKMLKQANDNDARSPQTKLKDFLASL